MKAVSAVAVGLIALLGGLTVWGGYNLSLTEDLEILKRSIKEMWIVGEINKFEILKRNLHQALVYSFYQSQYDVSKIGGYSQISQASKTYNNLPYWRIYTTTYLPDYQENMGASTLDFFKKYLEQIKTDVQMSIPSKVDVTRKDVDFASVKLTNDKLKLTKENLTIEENGNVLETIKTNVFKMYDLGKEKFTTTDSINQAVLDGISSAGLSSSGSSTACGSCPSDETVFQEANGMSTSQAKELIKQKIDEKINDVQVTGDISLTLEDRTKESDIQTSCSDSTGGGCNWDSCCYTVSSCTTDPQTGAETCTDECVGCYRDNYCTKSCSFTYYGAARALAKITDTKITYPVYDGTTDFRNMKLNFYVLSGNKELISP